MARINHLTKDDFYLPTLAALDKLGGSASVEELQSALTEAVALSEEDLSQTYEKSGALIAPDKMSWARSYLKEANLVESAGRGIWVLTDAGRSALSSGEEEVKQLVAEAMRLYNLRYREKKLARQQSSNSSERVEQGASDNLLGETWQEKLLARLKQVEPAAFERLAQRILRESGFTRVEVTGRSGDGGIDGNGVLRVNLISFQVLFQCKRFQGSVGAGVVRDFRGAMQGRADKGLIITTGTFTNDARREATRDGAPAIDLIDGQALMNLMRELKLGVHVEQIVTERVTVDEHFIEAL